MSRMSRSRSLASIKDASPAPAQSGCIHPFASLAGFEAAQRVALALAESDMVPPHYRSRKNIGSVLLAMEVAHHTGHPLMTVLQECYVIGGRPVWSAAFQIGLVQKSGRYSELEYEFAGGGDDRGCRVVATSASTGSRIEGPWVTMGMARAEGWIDRRGSKWKTLPDLMLRYRAATWFVSLHCPDLRHGIREETEVLDAEYTVHEPAAESDALPAPVAAEEPAEPAEPAEANFWPAVTSDQLLDQVAEATCTDDLDTVLSLLPAAWSDETLDTIREAVKARAAALEQRIIEALRAE